MSQRNRIGRSLAARCNAIRGVRGSLGAGRPTVLVTLGVVALMEAPDATAGSAVAFSLGGLLLIVAVAVSRGSTEPCKFRAVSSRVRPHPVRHH